MWFLLLTACRTPTPTVPTPPTTDTDVEDTAPPIPTADTAPELDCSTLPPLPTTFETLTDFTYAEDFDFDGLGRHVSVRTTNGNLLAIDLAGQTELLSANVASTAACTREMPDGTFIVCSVSANSLVSVDVTTGAKVTLLSGLSYPNGADVDAEGFIYVAEQNAGRLRRVHYPSGDSEVLATNLDAPNGVVLSPDEQTVFVGSFGGGRVYAVERTGPDTWGDAYVWRQSPGGSGDFDGIEADACGNIYLTEYLTGRVWRLPVQGGADVVATLPSSWIPNLRWGASVGGWDPNSLYVSDRDQGRLFVLEMGIGGAGQ